MRILKLKIDVTPSLLDTLRTIFEFPELDFPKRVNFVRVKNLIHSRAKNSQGGGEDIIIITMENPCVVKLPSMERVRVYPTNEVLAVAGPVGQNMYITNSLSASSFLRRERAHKAAWYPSRVLLAFDG